MKRIQTWLMAAAIGAACLGVQNATAQEKGGGGRGGFDPSQMRERMIEGLKDRMEIKDDAEWKAIQPLIEKVFDAQRKTMGDRIRGGMGLMRGGGGGGEGSGSNDQGGERKGGDRSRFRGGFGEPSAEAEALQKAIDNKASNSDIKVALAKFVEARKAHQAELEKAQAALRQVLTVKQEAVATLAGLL